MTVKQTKFDFYSLFVNFSCTWVERHQPRIMPKFYKLIL